MKNQIEADNLQSNIHDEGFYQKYRLQNLNRDTLIFTENRPKESLNGRWYFTIDPYDTGLRAEWHLMVREDAAGRALPWDYDPDGGDEMVLPCCWNMFKPEYHYYEGSAWYAREFTYLPHETGERVFLRVGAANYDTKVFVNREFLGNHLGGSTPFCVELTGKLRRGNIIQFCVDNTRTADRVPMRNTDWFNYGGIYRDVDIYRVKPAFIKDFKVYLEPDDTYRRIRAEVSLDGPDGPVCFEIPELGIRQSGTAVGGKIELTAEAPALELWSPQQPRRYRVMLNYEADRVELLAGFRQICVRGREILLNGKPLFLRGICAHEDDPIRGKASNEADLRQRFQDAKELGCNFMRLAHYPHTELAAQLADEIGMLLWEEIPVYWAIAFDNPATYADAENQLLELIRRDQNRASVIIWSVGNENADTDARLSFMSRLARAAKAADPTRLVSAACLVNEKKLKIEDRLAEYLDLIGLNEYFGWYRPDFNELLALGANSAPGKPVIITETGADGLAGHHGSEDDLFTEEHMAEVYRRQIEIVKNFPFVKGFSPWVLYDFRTPRRVNRYQRGYNRKGIIAADKKTRKLAYFVLQAFYREKQNQG